MLLRIDSLSEIGRFASLKHKAPQFTQLSLVFARNGYGKSTICAVLRSATEDKPNYILARRRISAVGECQVRTNWKSGIDAVFSGERWKNFPGNIFIFDQEFVFRNVHVGESVTRDNKRSLLPVVLGKKGVELSLKIIDLDREQRQLDAQMKEIGARIRAKCPVISASEVSAFCAKEVPEDIDKKVAKAALALELAKQAVAIRLAQDPQVLPIDELESFQEIAARTLANVSAGAAEKVREHFEKHNLRPNGDRWLKYGLDRVAEDCPFCDQPVTGLALIGAFKTFFSEAFADLTATLTVAIESIRVHRSDRLAELTDENSVRLAFWKTVCELPIVPELNAQDLATIDEGLDLLSSILERKLANPLEAVSLEDSVLKISAAFALIRNYNVRIKECILHIESARAAGATSDFAKANESHQKWLALRAKLSEPVNSAVAEYVAAENRRDEIDAEKEIAQSDLKAFAAGSIGARQREINELLSDFGANFSIADVKASFVGREPNTDYAISIGGGKIKVGEQSETEPSFKTVLSAGDKTTLALAFFISQLRSDPSLADAVVVFDDPFSSQDMHRQFETTSQIREIASKACQAIVLSHDPRFLDLIRKNAEASITSTFQLLCADDGSGSISAWSSDDELKALYVKRAEMIREYAGRGKLLKDTTEVTLVQAMRPFLEDYLRARHPGRFEDMEHLFDMASAIRQAGDSDPMFGSVSDLLEINEYSRPEHHGGGAVPDPGELRAQSKKIVRIIGAY